MTSNGLILTAPSDEQLRNQENRTERKTDVRAQGLSGRDWPTAIEDMFLRADLGASCLNALRFAFGSQRLTKFGVTSATPAGFSTMSTAAIPIRTGSSRSIATTP